MKCAKIHKIENLIEVFTVIVVETQSKDNRKQNNRMDSAPTLENAIKSTFQKSLKEFKETKQNLSIGDFVLARMRSYKPWPAKIVSFSKNMSSIRVHFYGSHNEGSVSSKEIIPFSDAFSTIRLIKIQNPKDFVKGVREIEIENGIPEERSSLREIELLQ